MYRATRSIFRGLCCHVHCQSLGLLTSRAVRLSRFDYAQRRSLHYDSDDPVFITKLQSIASNYVCEKEQQNLGRLDTAEEEFSRIITRNKVGYWTAYIGVRRELRRILEADARKDTPNWTKEERGVLTKLLSHAGSDFDINQLLTWLLGGYFIWVSMKPRVSVQIHVNEAADVDKRRLGSEANARWIEKGNKTGNLSPLETTMNTKRQAFTFNAGLAD